MSGTLRTLLLGSGTRSEAVEEIAASPALRDELRMTLPELERTIAGCGPEAVKAALAPLVVLFSVGEQAKVGVWWRAYLDALAGLPADAVQAACREYPTLSDSEFMPKPGPLRALAVKHGAQAFQAVGRAREALSAPLPKRLGPTTPEVTAKVAADLRRCIKRPPPAKPFAPPPTPTDGRGLSPAMAARLETTRAA